MKKLHDYQNRVAQFIIDNPKAFCILDVGLGKTAATLKAIEQLDVKVLVVAPKLVAEKTWPEENATWTPQTSLVVAKGTVKQRIDALNKNAKITVIGRDNLAWLHNYTQFKFDMLVIDESQSFKDPSSKRFKALKNMGFSRVVLLSATPVSEGFLGLWSQVFVLDRGVALGKSYTAYKQAYFDADYMGWSHTLKKGFDKVILKRIEKLSISMRAEDYLELPPRVDNFIKVEMPEMDVYKDLEKNFILELQDDAITAANAAVLWGKLHQLAGGAIYSELGEVNQFSTAKIDALCELVEANNGAPLLVFYNYKHEADRIIKAVKAERLDVDKWNKGLQKVAIAHPDSCGAGLNLQAGGSAVCWFSLPPSRGDYIQANGRLHRQGQTKPVVVHHLVTQGTIDERVIEILDSKAQFNDVLKSFLNI